MRGKSLRRAPRSFLPPPGFYLGFTVYSQLAEGQSFLEGSGGMTPRKFLCGEMQSAAFWDTILRNVAVYALTSSSLDDFSDIVTYIL